METSRSRSVFPVDCCGESPMETSRSRAVPDEDGHVRGNFYVRCTPSLVKSFRTSLAFALESRKGTAEEVESELNLKFDPEVLNLTEEDLVEKFASGVLTITSLSLAISYPALAVTPHMFLNAYKNVLAVALATEYSFPQAENVKEFIKDPSKFALAVAATVSGECGGAAEAVAVEEEVAEESDGDMGFDLFG